MFDIGFAELLIIAIVSLLVIGPERLPGAIRTGSLWLGRIKRGFNDIKRDIELELHNDAVLQELKQAGNQIHSETQAVSQEIQQTSAKIAESVAETPTEQHSDKS